MVPGLFDAAQVAQFVEGIDHALELRAANQHTPYKRHSSWFAGLSLTKEEAQSLGRPWIAGAGGLLACDSPKLLDLIFATYEDVGLGELLTAYLGERPVLSANKCTLRRVPVDANTDWHQDGAFLGSGLRALNVWVALTDCGDDAPGMDLVPRRFEEVQETGTGGAIFDWAVGPDVVAELSGDTPPVRPRFTAGDAVLFDDLCLHRTAIGPAMTRPRHAHRVVVLRPHRLSRWSGAPGVGEPQPGDLWHRGDDADGSMRPGHRSGGGTLVSRRCWVMMPNGTGAATCDC